MAFWRDLNTPDSFERDWYGELTNQISHTALGAALATAVCAVWYLVLGELPFRSWVFLGLFAGYLGVEIWGQGWTAGDSWFDSLMFGLGAAWAIMPFEETTLVGWKVVVTFDPLMWLGIFAIWSALLFFRVKRRYIASVVTQKD